MHTPQFALEAAHNAQIQYVDAHCWVFTPESFVALLREITEADLISFEVAAYFETDPGTAEFFISLRKSL